MALNKQELLNKLKGLQNKGSKNLFKPEEGETKVRIVPLKSNPENPFIQLYFHYNLNGKTYLSPLSYGESDPIADFSDSLVAEGNLSKEDYKQAKKFYPTMRTYVPIVVRGKEEEGVKFWAFGKQIYEQLLTIMTDDDYGDITDVTEGRDIKIRFTPQEKSDTNFAKTEIVIVPAQTPLSKNKDLTKKLLSEQPDLMEEFTKVSSDELSKMLQKHLSVEESTDESSESESVVVETAKASVPESVAEEFDAVFNS
jgi:hypothetical protein